MKWIKLPKSIPSMRALIQKDLASREDLISVLSVWDDKNKPKFDRSAIRAWRPIPNIQDFKIELQPFDWLISLFGLKKRYPSRKTFYTWFNEEANEFIDFKFKTLRKQIELKLYTEARDTIWVLMNSAAYQVSATNHVLRNWHRKLTYKEVLNISKQVDKLVKRRATKIDFSRVYIEKGENKFRPLGVPTPAWRIYLHMYNNCLVEWRSVTETGKQHGYLPGKGIETAWRHLASKLDQPNIYEADFEGFFNNVTHSGLHEILTYELNVPEREAIFIRTLNQSLVKLGEKDKMEEPDRMIPLHSSGLPNLDSPQNSDDMDKLMENLEMWGFPMPSDNIEDMGNLSWMLMTQSMVKDRGVPQGAPTSCSLATLALRFIEDKRDVVIYADDIIFFPNKLESEHDPAWVLEDSSMGIRCNKDKSRWLKKDGVWLVESFKFLGIRYYPAKPLAWNIADIWPLLLMTTALDILLSFPLSTPVLAYLYWSRLSEHAKARFVADTRKGATLEFTDKESFLSWLAVARELLLNSPYLQNKVASWSLVEWLEHNYKRWQGIQNPVKLLFMKPFKNTEVEQLMTYFEKMSVRSDLIPGEKESYERRIAQLRKKLWVTNPLTGFFLSRMQSNSWSLSVNQNFRLNAIAGSWVESEWRSYSWQWILPRNRLNVFVASSFANHDLLNWLTDYKGRKVKPRIRRVASKARKPWIHSYVKSVIENRHITISDVVS